MKPGLYYPSGVQHLKRYEVLAEFGTTGSLVEHLYYPTGIAIDQQGDVYVADLTGEMGGQNSTRIVKFSSTGKFLTSADLGLGIALLPENLGVDPQGNVYVRNNSPVRLIKLSPTHKVLTQWDVPQQYNILDVAVDAQENVYVTLVGFPGGVEKLSPTGKVLSTWNGTCTPPP
jgi:sugar lactone lactonase YvrE